MNLKKLKSALSEVKAFKNPKIHLEQYITPCETAAYIIYTAHFEYNDICDKIVVDLCSGTGMLSTGASFYKPSALTCVEVDQEAIDICLTNFDYFDVKADILCSRIEDVVGIRCDTVFMNPPFGSREKGADISAVEVALSIGSVVYSLHKTSTRKFILNKFKNAKVIAEIKYELRRTYSIHKKEKKYIEVDLYRITN